MAQLGWKVVVYEESDPWGGHWKCLPCEVQSSELMMSCVRGQMQSRSGLCRTPVAPAVKQSRCAVKKASAGVRAREKSKAGSDPSTWSQEGLATLLAVGGAQSTEDTGSCAGGGYMADPSYVTRGSRWVKSHCLSPGLGERTMETISNHQTPA